MGSRGSEFDVSNTVTSVIHNSEPDDSMVMILRNHDVTINGESESNEYGQSYEATNAKEAFMTIPYDIYEIDGKTYGRFEYKGKEYIYNIDKESKVIDKLQKDLNLSNELTMLDNDVDDLKKALNKVQDYADEEWEEFSNDQWNFM